MSELHQIFYKDEQRHKLYPFAKPYFNEGLTIYFENEPISKIVMATTADKIAVTSWKLQDKLRLRVGLRGALTQEALDSDYEVLSFTRNSKKHQMLAMANQWHKEFIPTIKLLWEKLGYKMPGETKQPVYQNHWSGKTSIYKKYVEEFLSPGMKLVETDEQLRSMMLQSSGYGSLNRQADLKSVKEKLGLSEYPLCPFIFERCPSLFFDLHKIRVSYL